MALEPIAVFQIESLENGSRKRSLQLEPELNEKRAKFKIIEMDFFDSIIFKDKTDKEEDEIQPTRAVVSYLI
eukprot:UC4_evm1s1455